MVKFTAQLSMTEQAFRAQEDKYRAAVATSAGVDVTDVVIDSVKEIQTCVLLHDYSDGP